LWKGRQRQLELDLDEVHTGLPEEFQVFVNGGLALMMGSIEMHEKTGRDRPGGGVFADQVEHQVTTVHHFLTFLRQA
jgi:hypothetical protein